MSLMRSRGYLAEAFESAADFLASSHCGNSACLIADVQMPGMTGFELHATLARYGKRIPTILITARHEEEGRVRALNAGIFCYLTKPFKEEALLKCLRSALAGHGPDGAKS